jgi:hypothetical protein
MPDIRIVPGNAIMSFTSSLNFTERITQDASGSLNLYGSGSTGRTELFSIDGGNGRLFTVSDDLSDSLFSVNTIAGLPVIEAFADNTVKMGQYGKNVLVVTGSRVGFGIAAPEEQVHISTGSLLFTSQSSNPISVKLSPFGGSANSEQYLDISTSGNLIARIGNSPTDSTGYGTGLSVTGRVNLRASALGSAATQILVFNGDPDATTRGIYTRTPTQLRSDIGAGVGSVTSIATNNGVTGGTISSTGTIGLAANYGDTVNPYASKTANNFLAAPNGSAGVPSFRAIAAADVPTLNQNTTGTATNATNAANIAVTDTTTTNATHYVTFTTGTSGNQVLRVDSSTLTFNPSTNVFTVPTVNSTTAVQGGNGSAGAPAFSFSGDTNTGMYNISADVLGFATAGAVRMRITAGGAMGLGITPTDTAGRFEASNDIVAFSTSDKRWKNNIVKIDSPLEKISQISGVEFDWIEDEPLHGNKGHDVGVIAQEIELVIPEAVQTRESGMKAVQYDKIIPLLIESIKEQQKQIDELKELVNKLTK